MTGHVWVSTALQQSILTLPVTTDIVTDNVAAAIAAQRQNKAGLPVAPEFSPKKIWAEPETELDEIPDLFFAMGDCIVSERAANIMRQFDLGGGSLDPVSEGLFQEDGQTRLPGNYFCWRFGNTKSAFLPDESPNLKRPRPTASWWKMPWHPRDDDVAVSGEALVGPDIWLDKMVFNSVFLSARLGDALEAAGLRQAFYLFKCRVI